MIHPSWIFNIDLGGKGGFRAKIKNSQYILTMIVLIVCYPFKTIHSPEVNKECSVVVESSV